MLGAVEASTCDNPLDCVMCWVWWGKPCGYKVSLLYGEFEYLACGWVFWSVVCVGVWMKELGVQRVCVCVGALCVWFCAMSPVVGNGCFIWFC